MPGVNTSYFQYLIQISSDIPDENKGTVMRQIGDVYLEHGEDLLREYLEDPAASESCSLLRDRMTKIDRQQMTHGWQASVDLIEEIASLLREKDIPRINTFVERLLIPAPVGSQIPFSLSHLYQLQLPRDLERVRAIVHPTIRAHVMAVLINRNELAIQSLALSKKEMMEVAPFLTYVNVEGAFDKWNQKEIHKFLDSLQHVKVLLINSRKVTRLPPLPYCRRLECCRTLIRELPELLSCEILDCRWCSKLVALPPLPRAHKVNCSGCGALTVMSDLSGCVELRCNQCVALLRLPTLPLARIVACEDCISLRFVQGEVIPLCDQFSCMGCSNADWLPLLPVCQVLRCLGCPILIQMPPLPHCEELDCRRCVSLRSLPSLPRCRRLYYQYCDQLDRTTLPKRFRPRLPLPFVGQGELARYEDRQMKDSGG